MVKKFHPPVHKILVLRSLDTVFPEDIKRKLMSIIFPPKKFLGRENEENLLFERLKKCAAKKMAWTKNSIIRCCFWDLIPFLLDDKAVSLTLDDLLNAERRYLHEWCECLALQHESFDSNKPQYDDEYPERILVVRKPPNWSLHDILPPKQKTPEERQYTINQKGKRVSN